MQWQLQRLMLMKCGGPRTLTGGKYFRVGCIPYLSTFASAGRQTTASEDDDNYLERQIQQWQWVRINEAVTKCDEGIVVVRSSRSKRCVGCWCCLVLGIVYRRCGRRAVCSVRRRGSLWLLAFGFWLLAWVFSYTWPNICGGRQERWREAKDTAGEKKAEERYGGKQKIQLQLRYYFGG